MILLLHAAFAAPCDAPVTNKAFAASLKATEGHFQTLDLPAFRADADALVASIPCVNEPLTPENAAQLHTVKGMVAFTDRDLRGAEQSFAAARASGGASILPTVYGLPDGPIAARYQAIELATVSITLLKAPPTGTVMLDGRVGLERRAALPAVYQRIDAGSPTTGLYLPSGAMPPDIREARSKELRGRPVLIAAGASILVSGGLFVGAAMKQAEFKRADEARDLAKIRSSANQNRGLVLAGVGAAAVGVGLSGLGLSIAL